MDGSLRANADLAIGLNTAIAQLKALTQANREYRDLARSARKVMAMQKEKARTQQQEINDQKIVPELCDR